MAHTSARTTTPPARVATPSDTPATPAGRGKPPIVAQPIWVTVVDAMRLSGIGRTKLYELIADKTLRSTTIGKRRLVSVASIEALGGEAGR